MNDFTPEEARKHTDELKNLLRDIEKIPELIAEAYERRVWLALDYESWPAYVSGEFGDIRLVHSEEERQKLAEFLNMRGLSVRAIASVVGAGKSTVARDLAASVPDGTVDRVASEAARMGLDGKTRATLTIGENLTRRTGRLARDILNHWGELSTDERDSLYWKLREIADLMSSVIEPPLDAREAFPDETEAVERFLSAV
jgi:transposase